MTWFFIALVAPILWAVVNIFDKYLVSKFSKKEKEKSSGGLVLFSSLIGIVIAVFIWLFNPDVSSISILDKLLLSFTGVLTIVWIVLYLYTLETEDISVVVPWFLMVPIFGYFLGFIFLGETLDFHQIIGSLLTLFGVFMISLDFSEEGKRFKWRPAIYMIIACFLVALSGIIFKFVTIGNSFWISSFWEYFGLGLAGLFIFIFIPKYRKEFLHMNRTGGKTIFLVNVASEFMTVAGNLLTNFALLLAPVTMVFLVGSFQPAFVLILGILGTRFFPHIAKEDLNKHVLFPRITAVGIMLIGSIILFM
jgi:drug/metabolite transporter (DMT)-like permease